MAVRLSALRADRTFSPWKIPGTHFCYRLSRPQGHRLEGLRQRKKSNNLIGNRTRDLPACSIVPHQLRYSVPRDLDIRSKTFCDVLA
jgi:hypothetical protein